MSKRILALICVLAMVLTMCACGKTDTTEPTTEPTAESPVETEKSGKEGGEATFYYPMFYNTFDPANQSDYCYLMMYESLFVLDYGSEVNDFTSTYLDMNSVTGQIAEGYTWDAATGTLVVTIRDGIFFQDGKMVGYSGRQLTASDVKYSYDRLLGLDGVAKAEAEVDWASTLAGLAGESADEGSKKDEGMPAEDETAADTGEAVTPAADDRVVIEADDAKRTVTFHFADGQWNDIALDTFLTTPVNIVGPEWDELSASQQTDVNYICGTGAWVLTGYVKDSYMVFDANPNYYMTDEDGVQLPYLDRVTLQYIADSDQIATQFISGAIDWFGDRTNNVLNASQLALIESSKDASAYTTYVYPGDSPKGIGFKLSQTDEPWSKYEVRLALQYALDGNAINAYLGNDQLVFTGLWSNTLAGYQATMDAGTLASWTTYDPEYAKQLLTDAGYPDGFDMTVVLDELQDQDLYVLAKSYWAAIGINVTFEVMGVMEQSMVVADAADTRQYNVPGAGGFDTWNTVAFSVVNGGFAAGYFYDSPEFDAAVAGYNAAQTIEERNAAAQKMDEIFTAEHWCVMLGSASAQTQMISSRIQGYHGEFLYADQHMRTLMAHMWIA